MGSKKDFRISFQRVFSIILIFIIIVLTIIASVNAYSVDSSVDSYSLNPGAVACGGFVISGNTTEVSYYSESDFITLYDDPLSFDDNVFVAYKVSVPENVSFGDYKDVIFLSDGVKNSSLDVVVSIDSDLEKSLSAVYDSLSGYFLLFVIFLVFVLLALLVFLVKIVLGGKR